MANFAKYVYFLKIMILLSDPSSSCLIRDALNHARHLLEEAGIDSARLDASVLLAHVLEVSNGQVTILAEKQLNNEQIEAFNALVARRQQSEPIAYILGKKEFWSLDFCVTRDTLIPRPDTETLVEAALKRMPGSAKPITLLDIGTGTGCLLIALLKEFPGARGVGSDNSERALQVAKENAKRHNVDQRAEFTLSHWCDAIDGTFDLILSNPPYIALNDLASLMPDVARFEPHAALFAGNDGLDAYRALAPQIAARLNPGGYTLLEVGQGQAKEVIKFLRNEGLEVEAPVKDLAGVERCVVGKKADNG